MTNDNRLNFRINSNTKATHEALADVIGETPAALARYMIESCIAAAGISVPGKLGEKYSSEIKAKIEAIGLNQIYTIGRDAELAIKIKQES